MLQIPGYKSHTDCTENSDDKRDRMATVLVYLDTVSEGGETDFPGETLVIGLHTHTDMEVQII